MAPTRAGVNSNSRSDSSGREKIFSQRRRADAFAEQLDVRGQIGRSAFFATFNDDDDAGVLRLLLFDCADRRNGGENRIGIIGTSAAIKPSVA